MTLATVALSCAKQIGRANAAGTSITALGAEIKQQIAEAIRFYNRKPWALTEFRRMELTTAADTAWYSTVDLSNGDGDQTARSGVNVSDIVTLDYVRAGDDELERVSWRRLERLHENTSSGGTPTVYAVYAGQIGLWPTPINEATLYMSGHVKPVVPTEDDDESVWFDQANELIEAAALKRVCTKYLRDMARAQQYETMERDAAGALAGESGRRSGSGRIKPHG